MRNNNESRTSKQKKITSIGGSALIEGIMMRGPKRTMIAVRTGDNSIHTEEVSAPALAKKYKIFKIPVIRGIAGLIDSMSLSYKSLRIAADKAIEAGEYEEEPSKFEKWLDEKLGDKLVGVLMGFASVIGVALAVFLFFFVPTFLFDLTAKVFPPFQGDGSLVVFYKSIFEGILKIVLFLGYIILCSQMKEMKRVFMYHGAEHKTIFCYEADEELTVENIKKQKRFHPRCGTSFMIYMLILGIVIGLFIPAAPFGISALRPIIKILLIPLSVGIGYEIIKLCGRHDNVITRILSAPGLWAQRITTKEPDDKMIEVAIAAMVPVIPDDGTDLIK